MPQQTVTRKLAELPTKFPGTNRVKLSEYADEDWARPLFDIWNTDRNANEVKHFGNTPVEFVDRLLYLYTNPFDIVIDPFAGGGSTIDAGCEVVAVPEAHLTDVSWEDRDRPRTVLARLDRDTIATLLTRDG